MRIHRESGWLSAVGIHRCATCGDPSPCRGELLQRCDNRDLRWEYDAIERQRQEIRAQYGLAP